VSGIKAPSSINDRLVGKKLLMIGGKATLDARASCYRSEDTTRRLWSHERPASLWWVQYLNSVYDWSNLCECFHWLTDERRLTNEKTHTNLDQSQTEFKYWTHQSEAGYSCDQSLLVVSSLLSQEALAPRVRKSRVSNLKKLGKLWLPIVMIGNFGNVTSSPVISFVFSQAYWEK
jgi:hypothetical protein